MDVVGLGGSEEEEEDDEDDMEEEELDDLLEPDLAAEGVPAAPPGCWALPLLLGLGASGGDTCEPGWCSGGKLGRMQLPFISLVLASCCCCWWWLLPPPPPPPLLLPSDCKEQAERWYESTSKWVADWKAGWWWDTGTS